MDFRMQTCSHYKVLCAIPDSIFRPFIWPTLRKIEKCLILTIVLLFSELNPIESDCFSGKNMDFGFIFDQARWTNRSNRPWIRPGTVKSLNAPWELSQLALRRDYAGKLTHVVCQSGWATYCTEYRHRIGSVHAVIWQAGTNWTGRPQSNAD